MQDRYLQLTMTEQQAINVAGALYGCSEALVTGLVRGPAVTVEIAQGVVDTHTILHHLATALQQLTGDAGMAHVANVAMRGANVGRAKLEQLIAAQTAASLDAARAGTGPKPIEPPPAWPSWSAGWPSPTAQQRPNPYGENRPTA